MLPQALPHADSREEPDNSGPASNEVHFNAPQNRISESYSREYGLDKLLPELTVISGVALLLLQRARRSTRDRIMA